MYSLEAGGTGSKCVLYVLMRSRQATHILSESFYFLNLSISSEFQDDERLKSSRVTVISPHRYETI